MMTMIRWVPLDTEEALGLEPDDTEMAEADNGMAPATDV